jgi:hypothetical protein
MLLALVLYLYDSLLLLAANEAVLVRGVRGRWRGEFGLSHWRVRGKEPYLPNPLTPFLPLFRLRWSLEGDAHEELGGPLRIPNAAPIFGAFSAISGLCIFVLFPIGLFQYPLLTMPAIVLLYANVIAAIGTTFALRTNFCLSTRECAGLCFECLACPPFAVNLLRRLCARVRPEESFTSAARRLLGAEALECAMVQCLAKLDEQLDYEPEGTPRMRAMQDAKARFGAPTQATTTTERAEQ